MLAMDLPVAPFTTVFVTAIFKCPVTATANRWRLEPAGSCSYAPGVTLIVEVDPAPLQPAMWTNQSTTRRDECTSGSPSCHTGSAQIPSALLSEITVLLAPKQRYAKQGPRQQFLCSR